MSVKTSPEKGKQVKVNPEKAKPVEPRSEKARQPRPVKTRPERTPAPVPSKVEPPPPTGLPPPYATTIPSPVPAKTAAEAPWLKNSSSSSSFTKSSVVTRPPITDPLPGPSTRSELNLRSPKSASTLLDGRVGDKPGRMLAASKSNPIFNEVILEAPKVWSDQMSIASTSALSADVPGLRPRHTPVPSSLLNNKPIYPPPKPKKRGFFSRLFGFGKSKFKEPEDPKPTKKLTKPTRPISTISVDSIGRLPPGPPSNSATRPISIGTSNSTQPFSAAASTTTLPTTVATSNTTKPAVDGHQSPAVRPQPAHYRCPSVEQTSGTRPSLLGPNSPRHRAVLTKKPPPVRPTRHSHPASVLTRPGRPAPRQNPGHRVSIYSQTSYSQSTGSFASFTQGHTTAVDYTKHAIPSNNNDHVHDFPNYNHTSITPNPNYAGSQPYGLVNHPFSTDPVQGTATNYTQYPGAGNHHGAGQSMGYTRMDHPGFVLVSATPDHALCTVCNTNPQYVDPNTGEISPYCTNVCQAAATVTSPQTPQVTCSYPGCNSPAIMYPADHHWNYCSESHERSARKGCVYCRQQAEENDTQLCAVCNKILKRSAPTVIPVPIDHDAFWHVVDRFNEAWAHPTQCPIVRAVYKVVVAQRSLDTYLGYRDTLEYYGQFTTRGKHEGNERILWHGTRRSCNLGEKGQTTPCMIPRCSLCSIIRGSSNIAGSTTDMPTGRFGAGVYTFTKTSRANDCTSNEKSLVTRRKALLMVNVAAGQEWVMHCDDATLKAPPEGYHSVYGGAGGSLSCDELVVYTNYAIRPTWLVMYNQE